MKKIIVIAIVCVMMFGSMGMAESLTFYPEFRAWDIVEFGPEIWLCRHKVAVLASEMKTANIQFYVEFGETRDKPHCRITYWKNGFMEVIDFGFDYYESNALFVQKTHYCVNMGVEEDEVAFKKWIEARFGEILVYAIQLD